VLHYFVSSIAYSVLCLAFPPPFILAPQTLSSSALPLGQAAQAGIPPITQLYQPSRLSHQGHPASLPASQPPAFHPFLGSGLNLPATSIANQARLASASTTIPRQVALPHRTSRRRGVASQPPVLSRATPQVSIQQCFVEGAPVPTVRVIVRVFPCLVCISFHT